MAGQHARRVTKFDESLFCMRLQRIATQDYGNTRLGNLVHATRRLLESASAISKQIVQFLPQFTSHDEIHLWNVLGFMEHLAGGKEEIEKLEAGDCAMAVWTAFIHDLGMVIEAGELAAIDQIDEFDSSCPTESFAEPPSDERTLAWRAYREGHEHWDSIRKAPQSRQSRMRLGLIRAAYVRESHARDDAHTGSCRIADWLKFLSESDTLIAQAMNDFATADQLVRAAVSHNQEIHWLERQLREQLNVSDPHAELVDGDLGTVHWTWIGWLLRLADVFDCDKSRTPRILFDHTGIADSRSQTEWQKHLSIQSPPLWPTDSEQQLLYICTKCPSPIVEKSIHQIIGWMNNEIENVRVARLAAQTKGAIPDIGLPTKAKIDIKQREGGYIYHDMEFRLDRDAVVELLMGESLYGGPELALREMVQNALDAVHLRDQRNKLAEELIRTGSADKTRQPHEPWQGVKPGVEVTWGEENGRRYIRVTDNGVGMTVATMRKFLTQIGKSYYKSDDFRAEQEMMRRHGILCTAISQFGIGFLSVFMLADHVTIHTRPVGAIDKAPADPQQQETARFPLRAEIHGPHGLLAFYPDSTIQRSGTKVTIWLKDKFVLPPWNRDLLIAQLKKEFYSITLPKEQEVVLRSQIDTARPQVVIDPGFEVAKYIVWPLYHVTVGPTADSIALTDSFHHLELVPLDSAKIQRMVARWDHSIPEADSLRWQFCDWTDGSITGSRVRLVFPHPMGRTEHSMPPHEVQMIPNRLQSGTPRSVICGVVDECVPKATHRYQLLVNGVRVVPGFVASSQGTTRPFTDYLAVTPAGGAYVWIDLRGEAMPKLRADRSGPTATYSNLSELQTLFDRWIRCWDQSIPDWLRTCIQCKAFPRPKKSSRSRSIRLLPNNMTVETATKLLQGENRVIRSNPQYNHQANRDDQFSFFQNRIKNVVATFDDVANLAWSYSSMYSMNPYMINEDCCEEVTLMRIVSGLVSANEANLLRQSGLAGLSIRHSAILSSAQTHILSEGLWPSITDSFPAFELSHEPVEISELTLTGPIHADRGSEHCSPTWINEYDICTPFTAIPFPSLRRKMPFWNRDRVWRSLLTYPLLMAHVPWDTALEGIGFRLPFNNLLLFMPNPDHYEWIFEEHTAEEWSQGSVSAMWDVKAGEVLYADGVHTEASLRQHGQPLREWLKV